MEQPFTTCVSRSRSGLGEGNETRKRHPYRTFWRGHYLRTRAIGTMVLVALACVAATTTAKAVTFDEVIVRPPLSSTTVDLVASDESPAPLFLVRFEQTPPGFRSGTIFLEEPPNSTNEGTALNSVNPRFPVGTSDALTIISDASFPFVNLFFISDGAIPRDISNFLILDNRFIIGEDGTLQDVSPFFGMPPGTVLVGSDVPEPSALLLLATGIAGLLGYGWRRR
jgi:PEP-CTERM motif